MPSLRSILVLLTTSLLPTAGLVNGALANPLCGLNSVFCYNAGTTTSTDASKSCSDPFCSASYDLIHGAFVVTATPGAAAVAAVDQYRVEGVSPGTPLVFSAELAVNLRAFPFGCYQAGTSPQTASVSATLREGDSNQSSAPITTPVICYPGYCCAQSIVLDQTIRVTVTRPAGELFTLHFNFVCGGSGGEQGYGQLHFSGLPPGAFVVSCQGYGQDLATAAKGESWGRLKLRYR
jgi:hypothetical protein